jgi:4-cresol dehydrogenase (hydroxylating)
MASSATTRTQWYHGVGAMPRSAIQKLMKGLNIGWWGLRFGLYGPKEVVDTKFKIVRNAFSRISHADITRTEYRRSEPISPAHALLGGIPTLDFMMLNWVGGAGAHIECPPVMPLTGQLFYDFYRRKTDLFANYGFDHHCGLTTTSPRCFINTGSIIFDRNDEAQTRRARELSALLIAEMTKSRLGPYRAHIAEMDRAAAQFDFNAHATMRTYERLKDALDPAGVLSPGKQGIWPSALRGIAAPEDGR